MSTLNNFKSLGELSKLDYITETHIQGIMGDINNPLLNLPLKNNLDMICGDGSVTFTRSTTATYIDRYGVVKSAAINTPRFEKEGLLVEGVSTNLCLDSEDITKWNFGGGGGVWSANVGTAPDGTITADLADSNDAAFYVYKSMGVSGMASGDTYTLSIWVKAYYDNQLIGLRIGEYGGAAALFWHSSSFVTLSPSDGFVRINFTATIVENDRTAVQLNVRGSQTNCDKVYLWGAQFEKLPFASSYIPTTTAAVTRNIEYGTVSTCINNIPAIYTATVNPEDLTMICDFDVLGHNGDYQYIAALDGYGYTLMVASSPSHNIAYASYGQGLSSPVKPVIEVNTQYKLGLTYNAKIDQTRTYIGGTPLLSRTGNSINTYYGSCTIRLGGLHWGRTLYGHMKNFKIYDKAFSENEIKLA